jgi:hypothetical protein
VIDKGAESLAQTLEVATKLLRHGDCKLAVTTLEEAAQHGWPVLGMVAAETAETTSGVITLEVGNTAWDYRGAEGVTEILVALDRARSNQATILRWGAANKQHMRFQPSKVTDAAPDKQTGFVTGTPIVNYTPILVSEMLPEGLPSLSLSDRHILFLTDEPQHLQTMLDTCGLSSLNYRIVSPIQLPGAASVFIDTSSESSIAQSLHSLSGFPFDTVIAIRDLSSKTGKALLEQPWDSRFIELLYAITQHAYEKLDSGEVLLGALCLGGANEVGLLDPETGLGTCTK